MRKSFLILVISVSLPYMVYAFPDSQSDVSLQPADPVEL